MKDGTRLNTAKQIVEAMIGTEKYEDLMQNDSQGGDIIASLCARANELLRAAEEMGVLKRLKQ